MSSPAEHSLDYKTNNYMLMQKPQGDQPEQTQKIQEFLTRLEEERLKIEGFKRELPLCVQLLNNAMETYKQQLETYQSKQGPRLVLEEFIPLKNISIEGPQKETNAPAEKASWMVSAQLWSPANDATKQPPTTNEAEHGFDVSPKLALDAKQRNGGAFLPFSKDKNKANVAASAASTVVPELALASCSEKAISEKKGLDLENGGKDARGDDSPKIGGAEQVGKGCNNPAEGQAAPQLHRKARRCWSPDLHRRFVNALQILGGSQVATPKQIRELMKVDGLTNDEVKSHLQKYRLHTRRPAPASQPPPTAAAPQLVVLGGIWVPPEYTSAAAAAAGPTAIYGAHPASAHYCTATPIPQDFYPPPSLPMHHHHHAHAAFLHRSGVSIPGGGYKGRMVTSPESEVRSGGERSESIEEEDVGEGDEREDEETEDEDAGEDEAAAEEKALVPLATKAEDSSGSGMALKL